MSARNRHKHSNITLLLGIFVLVLGLGYVVFTNSNPVSVEPVSIFPTPTPTPFEVSSPDGTQKASLVRKGSAVTLFSSDILGGNRVQLFQKTLEPNEWISLPSNSWSPDNTYLFLLDGKTGPSRSALVFKSSGKTFVNGDSYIDIGPLFKNDTYYISDVTGWDSTDLLHVETSKDATTRGPNYWFVIETRAFLQLAR